MNEIQSVYYIFASLLLISTCVITDAGTGESASSRHNSSEQNSVWSKLNGSQKKSMTLGAGCVSSAIYAVVRKSEKAAVIAVITGIGAAYFGLKSNSNRDEALHRKVDALSATIRDQSRKIDEMQGDVGIVTVRQEEHMVLSHKTHANTERILEVVHRHGHHHDHSSKKSRKIKSDQDLPSRVNEYTGKPETPLEKLLGDAPSAQKAKRLRRSVSLDDLSPVPSDDENS